MQNPIINEELRMEDLNHEVEDESGNEDVIIHVPFDPNRIKVSTRPYTLGQIVDDLQDQVIDLNTEFQRLPNLWHSKTKCRFIESILLKMPIPAFYFNENEENSWEVIDGLQRVGTLKSFIIDKDLVLTELEFLKEFNNCKFDDLPNTLKRRIRTFPITLYLIEKGTPDDVKFNIFKRINQGSLILTSQEIRHAINQGKPAELVADLVRGKDSKAEDGSLRKRKNHDGHIIELKATSAGIAFVKATGGKISSIRMEDRDFATRYMSFYLIPSTEYEPDLDTFLNKGMSKIKELSTVEIKKAYDDFEKAMNISFDIFGQHSFRKLHQEIQPRKPINKALFEVLSVNFSKLSLKEIETLGKRKEVFLSKFIDLHNNNAKFLRSITHGTAQKENVEQRFSDIITIIKETLK